MSNLNLLDFINSKDSSDIESIQKFENAKWPITKKLKNIWECISTCNHDLSTPKFHNVRKKIKVKFGFAPFF